MFKKIIITIKAFFIWILKEKNRGVPIKHIKLALTLAKIITPLTNTEKDDKALEYVMKKFTKLTETKTQDEIKRIAEVIDKNTKDLDGLNLSISSTRTKGTKIEASYGLGKVDYNPINGEIKLGLNI